MERKLTAILCADVHGYSRLMGDNEEATFRTLASHRQIIDRLIQQHHGRLVNSSGDSVLAEFASVLSAVQCGIETQAAIKAENVNLPPERRMQFRVGINLGEVIVEDKQIYGDGVNVAARLESLAEPGGICISGKVHEEARGKLPLNFADLGVQKVKNIAEPIRIWRVLVNGAAPGRHKLGRIARRYWLRGVLSLAGLVIIVAALLLVQRVSFKPPRTSGSIPPHPRPALALPDKPSIAVLPFRNLSGDPQQEYFSDGITDDLTTDLSRLHNLFVIAPASSFTYKGKSETVETIGRDLGVKYLLEGSARRAGDQVRINVQLVDATTGNQVWSQRYDRQLRDIFKLQDEIVHGLVNTLGLQLPLLEKGWGSVVPQRTNNLEAYDYFLRGFEECLTITPEANKSARNFFERAIVFDPGYAEAYARLALVSLVEYTWQWDDNPHALDRAEQLARRAALLDDSNSDAYAALGSVAILRRRPNEAIAYGERAIELDPNNTLAYLLLSNISGMAGKPEAELAYAQKAMRLDPRHPEFYLLGIGSAYLHMGRYQEAVDNLRGALPGDPWTHVGLARAYIRLGREQDARAEAAEVLRVAPKFSLETVRKRMPGDWDTPTDRQLLDDLRKAGLK